MPVLLRYRGAASSEGVQRRCYIQHREVCDRLRVIQRKSVSDPCSAVMAHDPRLGKSKSVDQLAHILGHRLLLITPLRLVTEPIAAQIRCDHSVVLGKSGDDPFPALRRLWPPMQQHQQLLVAAGVDVTHLDLRQARGVSHVMYLTI